MKKVTSVIYCIFYIFLLLSTFLCVFYNNKISEIAYLISNILIGIFIIYAFFHIDKIWCRIIAIIGVLLNIAYVVMLVFYSDFLFEKLQFQFYFKICRKCNCNNYSFWHSR